MSVRIGLQNRHLFLKIYLTFDFSLGSTYNISIISFSKDNSEGGVRWLTAETEIGIPDPIPPTPTILDKNGKSITIEIPHFVNNNGPVTAIHVVVIFVDSELSLQFDEHFLRSFKYASEEGINYYITAELSNEVLL